MALIHLMYDNPIITVVFAFMLFGGIEVVVLALKKKSR